MQHLKFLCLTLLLLSAACGDSSGDDDDGATATGGKTAAGKGGGGESGKEANSGNGGTGGNGGASGKAGGEGGKASGAGGKDAASGQDASIEDAAIDGGDNDKLDGGIPEDAGDAGTDLGGGGSCCTEHETAGCNNADLQVCVCERLPSCCTEAWGSLCVLIVEQKYCEEGVRDCVCGTEQDQWGRTECCDERWGDTCDTVAELKCGATPGCF